MPAGPRQPLRIAVCVDTRDGPGRQRLRGIYQYALQKHWRLIWLRRLATIPRRHFTTARFDGALIYDRNADLHRWFRRHRVPCVELGACNLALSDGGVFSDDPSIGAAAARHLLAAGFEHFAFCGLVRTVPSRERGRHFNLALTPHGHAAATFEDTHADGEIAMGPLMAWLRKLPKPVGMLVYDDKLAERVLAACRWASIPVPDQVGVLGVGDDELVCEMAHPRLSSIAVPAFEMGYRAAALLDALVAGSPPAQRFQAVPCRDVVVRASTDWLPPLDPTLASAVATLRSTFHLPIGTDQVADAVALPRRTLERRFKAALGKTVHGYLIELRLRLAKQLLQQSHLTLSHVAGRCGYKALSAFCTMFKSQMACHPRTYRSRYATPQ